MVPDQIANQPFTPDQKEYLRGFFAGVSQRSAVPFVGHTASGLTHHFRPRFRSRQ